MTEPTNDEDISKLSDDALRSQYEKLSVAIHRCATEMQKRGMFGNSPAPLNLDPQTLTATLRLPVETEPGPINVPSGGGRPTIPLPKYGREFDEES
jgi:hypothetical protein